MKLDKNMIAELTAENERLEEENHKAVANAKATCRAEGKDEFNDWYDMVKDVLYANDEKIRANKEQMTIIKATNIEVGDGISMSPWTDWCAYTVIERKDTPKGFTLTIQEDNAVRTDDRGMSDSQEYKFERDTNGRIATVKWNPRSQWFSANGYKVALGRHAYYDYSF